MPLDEAISASFQKNAMQAELLDQETETRLAKAWKNDRHEPSLHRLINAYMRLAISIAYKFRRYGAAPQDLVQEAGIGLLKAADKFDPDRGVRFSTYARWWVKASVQEFVMRNYSMVRTGSTTNQKALFFNLSRIKNGLSLEAKKSGKPINQDLMLKKISDEMNIPMRDVLLMDGRLSGGDFSLNASQSTDEESREWIDLLEDEGPIAEDVVSAEQDNSTLREWIEAAFVNLSERERFIIEQRKMIDETRTLESIAIELGLSKERIRQVEAKAIEKLKKALAGKSRRIKEVFDLN